MGNSNATLAPVMQAPTPEQEPFIRKPIKRDGLLILFMINLALLLALILSIAVDQQAMRLFTYKWTDRFTGMEEGFNMKASAERIKHAFLNNTNSSPQKLGELLDDAYEWAGCSPVVYGGEVQWGAGEISPTCNCLRNLHVEYAKAVRPNGTRLEVADFDRPENKENVTTISNAAAAKCFYSLRNTQVETTGDWQTNTVTTAMFWNSVGCIVSLFVLFFDGILHMHTKDSIAPPEVLRAVTQVTIMGIGHFSNAAKGVLIVPTLLIVGTAIILPAASWSDPMSLIWTLPCVLVLALFCTMYCVWENAALWTMGRSYSTMRAVVIWMAFCAVAPVVANTMNMLVQRRDSLHNVAAFYCVLATGLLAISMDLLQGSFEDDLCDECDEKEFHNRSVLNRRKNTLVKVMLLVIIVVILMLFGASIGVFMSSSFSNMSYTVLVASALLMLCFISCFRHLELPQWQFTHNGMWAAFFNSSGKWDLYPVDPLTLEICARFLFTLAALADIWMVNNGQWDRRFQAMDYRNLTHPIYPAAAVNATA